MKLKALELLEQISTEWCISDANILIDEAIKELEELENRSCSNCKHLDRVFNECQIFKTAYRESKYSYDEFINIFGCNFCSQNK
ncbi:MAG: hypothetical protein WC141_10695 [Arcobacteraceae bacterium]